MPPWEPLLKSVATMTWAKSASSASLMKRLTPLITYSSPSRTARVRMEPGSEPASGSVWAKQARFSSRSSG